ncbi:anthrone oxygenase family protein [Streptomyces sp. NPDC003717]|uniref:anthrone oxygenase family protein n=1 Tax=Streptomyces sp. NPDC003717 TaxID=3154276 RepID=UPI0033B38C46
MIDGPYLVLAVLGVLGTGMTAGVFYAFSTFVMRGLSALPPAQGVAAMNAINTAAVRVPFMLLFLGTAALALAIGVVTCVVWPAEGAVLLLVGSALYLVGSFGVTVAANVPRNAALLRQEPGSAEAAGQWGRYVREWTAWNHIRTAASVAATAAYVLALV